MATGDISRDTSSGKITERDYVTMADSYVSGVLDGRIVAGQWTVKACRRFERMRQRASDPTCHYRWSPAARAGRLQLHRNDCRMWKAAGAPRLSRYSRGRC